VSDEETSFDRFLPMFQKTVSLAEALLSPSDISSKPDKRRSKKFLYEDGVIPPLYLVGLKCRDPVVRRKAQGLLASARRKEGVWESDKMAKVVEQIIAIEESGRVIYSSSQVPEEARVWRKWIIDGENDKPSKVVCRLRVNSSGGVRIVERILD
jgi:hypothetical protein